MTLSDYSLGRTPTYAAIAVAACGLNACIFASDPTSGEDQVTEDTGVMEDTTIDGGMSDGGSLDGGSPDGGSLDGGSLDGGAPDGGGGDTGPGVPPTDLYYFSSGGGQASSGSYRMKASFGAPSPKDEASSSSYRIQLAPVSP
jgi:hypothetical protein